MILAKELLCGILMWGGGSSLGEEKAMLSINHARYRVASALLWAYMYETDIQKTL